MADVVLGLQGVSVPVGRLGHAVSAYQGFRKALWVSGLGSEFDCQAELQTMDLGPRPARTSNTSNVVSC